MTVALYKRSFTCLWSLL